MCLKKILYVKIILKLRNISREKLQNLIKTLKKNYKYYAANYLNRDYIIVNGYLEVLLKMLVL